MTRTPAQRNIDAEARAVEEGHRAFVQPGGWVRVVSDSFPDKAYRVEFAGTRYGVRFVCEPIGSHAFKQDHLHVESPLSGVVPCKHAAVAARRLEREGLIRFAADEGLWRMTDEAEIRAREARADERLAKVLKLGRR